MKPRDPTWLLLLLLAAAGLRVLFFSGGSLYDDVNYLDRAIRLAQGHGGPPLSHFEARLGLVGPAALVIRVFGLSPVTAVAVPFLASLSSVAVAWTVARRLWNVQAAALAAGLVAVAPLEIIYATQLYANAQVTLLCGAAFGIFLLAERDEGALWRYLASGACFGLATVVHEASLLALAFYVPYVVVRRRLRVAHLALFAGLILALAVDPLVHGFLGDPLARLHTVEHHGPNMLGAEYAELSAGWLVEPFIRLAFEQELGLFPWLIAPVAVLRLFRGGDGTQRALAVIVVCVGGYVLYGTVSPSRWASLVREPRYLAPIVLPCAWLLACELQRWRAWPRRAAVAALVLTSLACVTIDGGRGRLQPYRELVALLDREGATRVAGDRRTIVPLRLLEGLAPRHTLLDLRDQPALPPGTVVVARSRGAKVPAGPTLVEVTRIFPPTTLYRRLLASSLTQRVLRIVRGAVRMQSLRGGPAPPELIVYRVAR